MPRKKKDEAKASGPSLKKTKEKKPSKTTARKASKAKDPLKTPKAPSAQKSPRSVSRNKPVLSAKVSLLKKLPRRGETKMVAFIRDPRCIFTYWEVSPENIETAKKQLLDEYPSSSMVLRVFKVHPEGEAELIYEVEVGPNEKNRYLELKEPSGRYFVEVVQRTASGRIVVYARSNGVSASPDRGTQSSAGNDPQWAPPAGILEYFNEGEDSPEFHVTHPGVSSADSQRGKKSKWDSYAASWTR